VIVPATEGDRGEEANLLGKSDAEVELDLLGADDGAFE
jgi:hypothetical protein